MDAVIVIAALFALFAYARSIARFESHHFWAFVILLAALGGFGWAVVTAGNRVGDLVGPKLHELEESSSP